MVNDEEVALIKAWVQDTSQDRLIVRQELGGLFSWLLFHLRILLVLLLDNL